MIFGNSEPALAAPQRHIQHPETLKRIARKIKNPKSFFFIPHTSII
jgi:hypothetical protein